LPGGNSLSFASPKESKQRKGDPQSGSPTLRYGATCGARAKRGLAKLAPFHCVQTTRSLIRLSLRSSAQPGRGNRERGQIPTRTRHGVSLFLQVFRICLRQFGICIWLFGILSPTLLDAPRSGGSGGSGIALSEPKASLARPRLNRAPQVARSEAKGRSK